MCMEDNGKRMLSWDIVKGITILIMIVGHVASCLLYTSPSPRDS